MDRKKLRALLEGFGIALDNRGVCLGPGQWRGGGAVIASSNPANEQPLARIALAAADDLAAVIETAVGAAPAWRHVPAPPRGEAVPRFGKLPRGHKDAPGTLLAPWNGKIQGEGDRELQ